MASIVDYEKMVGSSVLEEARHLNSKLNAGIGHGGDMPPLSAKLVLFLEDLLKGSQVLVN